MNKSVKVGATIVGLFTAASNLIGCASSSRISDMTPGHTEQSQSEKVCAVLCAGQEISKKVDGARTVEKSTTGILMPDLSGLVTVVYEAPGSNPYALYTPYAPYYGGYFGGYGGGGYSRGHIGHIHGGTGGYAHCCR